MCLQHQHAHAGVCAQHQREHADRGGLALVHVHTANSSLSNVEVAVSTQAQACGCWEAGSRCPGQSRLCKSCSGLCVKPAYEVKVSIQGRQPFYLWTEGWSAQCRGWAGKAVCRSGRRGLCLSPSRPVCAPRTPAFKPGGPPPSQVQADCVA